MTVAEFLAIRDMSQSELARLSGISQTTISRAARGIAISGVPSAKAVSAATGGLVTTATLLGLDAQPTGQVVRVDGVDPGFIPVIRATVRAMRKLSSKTEANAGRPPTAPTTA